MFLTTPFIDQAYTTYHAVPMPGIVRQLLVQRDALSFFFLQLRLPQWCRSALTEIIRQSLLPTPHFDAILLQAGRRQNRMLGPLRGANKLFAGSWANCRLTSRLANDLGCEVEPRALSTICAMNDSLRA